MAAICTRLASNDIDSAAMSLRVDEAARQLPMLLPASHSSSSSVVAAAASCKRDIRLLFSVPVTVAMQLQGVAMGWCFQTAWHLDTSSCSTCGVTRPALSSCHACCTCSVATSAAWQVSVHCVAPGRFSKLTSPSPAASSCSL